MQQFCFKTTVLFYCIEFFLLVKLIVYKMFQSYATPFYNSSKNKQLQEYSERFEDTQFYNFHNN